jgi:hypothetical protein
MISISHWGVFRWEEVPESDLVIAWTVIGYIKLHDAW